MIPFRENPQARRVASGYTIAGRTSCWLTPGRLVVVEQQLVLEEYRRFDLRNIQALVLCETRMGSVASVLLLVSILAFFAGVLLAVTLDGPVPVTVICSGSALLLAISLVLHRWRGPTAHLEIHTAVQRFRVPGVHRWRAGFEMLEAVADAASTAQAAVEPRPDSESVS